MPRALMFLQGFIYIFHSESERGKVQLKENGLGPRSPSALGSCVASSLRREACRQHLHVEAMVEVAVDLLCLLGADLGSSSDGKGGAVRDHRRAPHLQLFRASGQYWDKRETAAGQEASRVRKATGTPRAAGGHLRAGSRGL